MLIRSQDKTCITNMEQVTDVFCGKYRKGEKYNIIAALAGGNTTNLGKYNTEEKAIKVLDMIEQAYCKSFEEQKQNYFGHRYNLIFHMPKDEEVEE